MNRNRSDLLTLLKLLSGESTPEEGQRARQRIADDLTFRQRWHQVSTLWNEQERPGIQAGDRISAELTAGFIDGELSGSDLQRVELACWDSESVLRDIVHAYRLVSSGEPVNGMPKGLTNRLLQLHPASGRPPEDGCDSGVNVGDIADRSTHEAQSPRLPRRTLGRDRGRAHTASFSRFAAITVTGCVVLLAVVVAAVVLLYDRDVEDAIIAHPEPSVTPVIRDSDEMPVPAPELDDAPEAEDAVIATSSPMTPAPEAIPAPEMVETDPGPGRVAAATGTRITWTSVEGLLAVRNERERVWRAAGTEWILTSECELTALPRSRAEGELGEGVGILLDGDSSLILRPHPRDAGLPEMSVEWGRLALFNLGAGMTITVPWAITDEVLQIERDGTGIAIEQWATGGRMHITSGEVTHAGRSFGTRASLVWDNGVEEPLATGADSPAWLAARTPFTALDEGTMSKLADSDDLIRDLESLMHESTVRDADTIVAWNLALAPESAVLTSLNADAHDVRVAALNWLAGSERDDARRRAAWRAFAGALGEPETARAMVRWFRAAHEPARADRQMFAELLGGLDHPALAVRETADYCLQRITGMRVAAYRADADPDDRRQGVVRWRAAVARIAGGRPAGNATRDRRRRG